MTSQAEEVRAVPLHESAKNKVRRKRTSHTARRVEEHAAASQTHAGEWVRLDEHLRCSVLALRSLRAITRRLGATQSFGIDRDAIAAISERALERLERSSLAPADVQVLRLCVTVFADLASHGWMLRVDKAGLYALTPRADAVPEAEKDRVRAAHLIERDAQLREPSTKRFLDEMERRRPTRDGWRSVFSLMRDGRVLAAQLREASAVSDEREREELLRHCIQPYIQVVEPDKCDDVTGLPLMDIWRYFRHTWTTSYNSTPGRKLYVLIRDRAMPEHPVIGIAALGSAIVQMADRDRWIGWSADTFLARLSERPTVDWARWLLGSVDALISEVYVRDLINDALLVRRDLEVPGEETIARLRAASQRARDTHRLYSQAGQHKAAANATARPAAPRQQRLSGEDAVDAIRSEKSHWRQQAQTHLFRSKRCAVLADLLEVRMRLRATGLSKATASALKATLSSSTGRRAVLAILRRVRAAHVGVDMMDITVCGAVAPYNALLGGKLVSLLMTCPEVVAAYAGRYRNASSVIASSMAGRAVRRRPRLVFLGTTSLYGVAASQYNRLKIPADEIGALEDVRFVRLGRTAGFGSYQFSRRTLLELEAVASRGRRGREVNSIFGEGVNPKLRKIRGALEAVGLPSEALLQHGSPRLIYGVPLAQNFREVLLGTAQRPRYLIQKSSNGSAVDAVAAFWRRRWLRARLMRPDVLSAVESNTLAFPVTHGARVQRPAGDERVGFDEPDFSAVDVDH